MPNDPWRCVATSSHCPSATCPTHGRAHIDEIIDSPVVCATRLHVQFHVAIAAHPEARLIARISVCQTEPVQYGTLIIFRNLRLPSSVRNRWSADGVPVLFEPGSASNLRLDRRSDQFGPYRTTSSPRARTPHVLDGLLYLESCLVIDEHFTDTGGSSDDVFAVCPDFEFRFARRIRNLREKRPYSMAVLPSNGDRRHNFHRWPLPARRSAAHRAS